jgi:hypothetical protein
MNFHNDSLYSKIRYRLLMGIVAAIIIKPVVAEVVLQHPDMGSVVFSSPETQQTAIQPAEPVFVHPPPSDSNALVSTQPTQNWWGAPPAYYYNNDRVDSSPYPSNRDVATYHGQRAHNFSQDLYKHDKAPYWYYYGAFGLTYPANYPPYYFYPGYPVPYYPPPRPMNSGEFNQSSQPSNQDINIYNLNRAHQFSADRYKAP